MSRSLRAIGFTFNVAPRDVVGELLANKAITPVQGTDDRIVVSPEHAQGVIFAFVCIQTD